MTKKPELPASLARPSFQRIKLAYTFLFSALIISYIAFSFLITPSSTVLKHYNLTVASYRYVLLPLVVLIVGIWLTSLYGAMRFKNYSDIIRNSEDGQALEHISAGLLVLALSLPINSVLNSLFSLIIRHHANWQPRLTIAANYISLALLGLAFILIARGADALQKLVPNKKGSLDQGFWVSFFIVVSTLYSYFLIIQPIHTPLPQRSYFLSNWLLLITIAIPYLYIWYRGLNAVYGVYRYQVNVRGSLYKSALKHLAFGLLVVVASSVLTEILTTISSRLSKLNLTPVLLIVYGLLILSATGYALIAVGAKKLRKLEEV